MATQDHVLVVPTVVFALRILQIVVGVVLLGLSAYGVQYISLSGSDLTLFTSLATLIIAIYYLVSTMALPVMYNYWAVLGLDIFAVIFWIISFSLLASQIADITIVATDYYNACDYYGNCYYKRSLSHLSKRDTSPYTWRNAQAAAAGLGGLEFILFVVTLVFIGLALHRHRAAGGHCMPGQTTGTSGVTTEPKPMEMQSNNGQQAYPQQATQQPVYQEQAYERPAYAQQPVQHNTIERQPVPNQEQTQSFPVQQTEPVQAP